MKKIPPILITIIMIAYFSLYLLVFFLVDEADGLGKFFLIVMGVMGVGFIGAMLATLFTRLKEISKEDKNDLDKY